MKTLIVYDSFFGNTEKIAKAIGSALGNSEDVSVCQVANLKPEQMQGVDLIIVGSPTRAFRPTKPIQTLLASIPARGLQGVQAAAFDTRISIKEVNNGFLNVMVKLFGYAAEPIAKQLAKKGAALALPAEGFFVKESEGPLKDGELERAADWAKQISAA
ncbi:MAG: flavodoxin family protein [Anaerolineaceae bacterium]|nr:flavodoxin family protein [Anaerolineaceae bacterium]